MSKKIKLKLCPQCNTMKHIVEDQDICKKCKRTKIPYQYICRNCGNSLNIGKIEYAVTWHRRIVIIANTLVLYIENLGSIPSLFMLRV